MTELPLHSTKYDGSLHYRFMTRPLRESPGELVTYSPPGQRVESYRGASTGVMHMLSYLWSGRHFNLHICWHEDWRPRNLYVNIATPATWHDGAVRYVDLDLDVILRHGAAALHLDDEDEFEVHRTKWSYPEDLVARCHTAVEEVRALFAKGDWPFTEKAYAWRPGDEIGRP
ncbi:MAG: DUF402 domain-containing protein [Planctomycetota bacterium]|nr:DUF402 domain-containing protein [Planctomycetota bacterium]